MHHSMDPRNSSLHHNQQSPQDATRKVFTGKVTKMMDTFGFIDGEVFFQPTVVRGGQPKVGDSVYAECQYSEHLPFKWNATRVQILSPDSSAAAGNKQQPVVSSSYVPQPVVGLGSSPMSHGSSSGSAMASRDDGRQATGNNYWQSGSTGSNSGSNPGNAYAGASRNPVFVSEYTQQPSGQDNSSTGPPAHHFPGMQGQPPSQVFGGNNFSVGNGNSVTYTTTPGSAFLSSQIPPPFDPSVSIGPPGPFPGQVGGQHSGPVRENRTSRWEPRDTRGSGPVHRDSDDRRRHDRRDIRIERDRKDGKDEFGRDRPPVDRESRNSRFSERERQREKSLSPGSNTGSVSSRYDSKKENLPNFHLLPSNLSSLDIRTRYGNKIHIPSDFETLLVNEDFEMDLNSIPKPIQYKIHETKKRKEKTSKDSKPSEAVAASVSEKKVKEFSQKSTSNEQEQSEVTSEVVKEEKNADESSDSTSKKVPPVKVEQGNNSFNTESIDTGATAPVHQQVKQENANANDSTSCEQSESSVKYNGPKHGVKVILLSLPEVNFMFEKIFGYDFERQTSSGYFYPLNKLISFLAFRNQNDGYSLLGGKFNVQLDGFIGEKPNLIATAIRSVKEQTGIDLTPCSRWISLGSFLYNRDDSINERPSIEYSTVFMPDVWTLLDSNCKSEEVKVTKEEEVIKQEEISSHQVDVNESLASNKSETSIDISEGDVTMQQQQQPEPKEELDKLDELKVVELKSKLDSLGIKYSRTLKKAELLSLLKEHLSGQTGKTSETAKDIDATVASTKDVQDESMTQDSSTSNIAPAPTIDQNTDQATATATATTSITSEPPPPPPPSSSTSSSSVKRKIEQETDTNEPPSKKQVDEETNVEKEKEPEKEKEKVIDVNGDFSFSLLTLHQALNHHKHDHFELSICAELVRESLIRSFGYYIASTLKENSSILKQQNSIENSPSTDRRKVRAPTFLQLVFSYFDERHTGTIHSDDLLLLLLYSGYKISKKSWLSLTSNCEKIQYKNLNPPNAILKPPKVISPLVESSSTCTSSSKSTTSSSSNCTSSSTPSVIVKDGVLYDLDNLIKQGEKFSKAQIQLQELTQRLDEREKQLSDFETRQKKMTSAIEKQNDEICALKREKESLKNKVMFSFTLCYIITIKLDIVNISY